MSRVSERSQGLLRDGLEGSAVLVTGAGSGMGAAAVGVLSRAGARVLATDVDERGLDQAVDRAREGAAGAEVVATRCDVAAATEVRQAIDGALSSFGRLDGVAHFAGILDRTPLFEITDELWDHVVDVNLKGSFHVAREAARVMERQGSGSIVLTASDSARAGSLVSGPAYASSKGGVIALTRALAKVLGPSGVRVNAVCPGLTMTGMSGTWEPELIDDVTRATPLRRLGESADMASVAAFLLSDLAGFMTGEIVEVNGGVYFD